MKRIAAIALVLLAAGGIVVMAGAGDSSPDKPQYTVELDNAFGLIEGGDFKVAGVRAGTIDKLTVDRKTKRALVDFTVTETGFGSLREDVECQVAPQSLVGEYYVDCAPGTSRKELEPGSTIPVSRTSSTVPPDLVNNIMRLPRRERFRIILGELGAAVAGNARNLNAAIRRAVPALRETNRVLAILSRQNQILADLARDADTVIGDLAGNRRDVARWVVEARDTARTSAERDRDIARGFERLPRFLAELEPTMVELGKTADNQGPALRNLAASSERLEELFDRLPAFADANRPALRSLGEASVKGREAVKPAQATVAELERYAAGVPELGKNLAIVLEHLNDRKHAVEDDPRSPGGKGYTGLEALLQYVFDQGNAINIHDGEVHILKVFPFEGECAPYGDIRSFKELSEHCGRLLGPNPLGIKSPDPSAPPGWDQDDHGTEDSDQSVRRRAARPEGETEAGGGDAGGDGSGDGARDGDARRDGGSGGGGGGGGGIVQLPKLDDVLPAQPPAVEPPKVPELPNVGGDVTDTVKDGVQAPARDEGKEDELLDYLLG